MKRPAMLFIVMFVILLVACARPGENSPTTTVPETTVPETTVPETTVPETTVPETTVPETTVPETTVSLHSLLYLPECGVEDALLYFREVCLNAEYYDSGNPNLLQKWVSPITYDINGEPTDQDLAVIAAMEAQLNEIPRFPGFRAAEEWEYGRMQVWFCSEAEMGERMGDWAVQEALDGAVTFWYNDLDEITDAIICVRTDLDQYLRNSVIQEEIYNGLGPIQDTVLRPDSLICQDYSMVQAMTEVDLLILKLLYHPDMKCGMTDAECEAVIRQIYY